VGTGKSFLSICIAKEVLESGHSVLYFSAAALFDKLSMYSFDVRVKDELRSFTNDLYTCDLLIIDDLGTELTNQFISAQLFTCLNERHLGRKSTVISTNLSLKEMQARYSDRVFSRITNDYELYKLTGSDIRVLKRRLRSAAATPTNWTQPS
jgi:DNA replication protein DnaC